MRLSICRLGKTIRNFQTRFDIRKKISETYKHVKFGCDRFTGGAVTWWWNVSRFCDFFSPFFISSSLLHRSQFWFDSPALWLKQREMLSTRAFLEFETINRKSKFCGVILTTRGSLLSRALMLSDSAANCWSLTMSQNFFFQGPETPKCEF